MILHANHGFTDAGQKPVTVDSGSSRSSPTCNRPLPGNRRNDMRAMVIVKAIEESEAGSVPNANELAEMGRFNAKLVEVGVMFMAEGPAPSAKGVRVHFDGKQCIVIDGRSPKPAK
jgi:hypothetical protein